MKIFSTKIFALWLTLMLLLMVAPTWAQQAREIKGKVISAEDNGPLVGVAIVIQEHQETGAVTNLNGEYTIKASNGEHLIFSYLGSTPKIVEVNKTQINVTLDTSITFDDVVKIGYAPIRKKEVTGATVQVTSKQLESVVSSDLGTALQGLVSGLSISASSGDPGSVANIQIRGVSSMSGNNTPLFVVDGIPQEDYPDISSSEIATIDVLKDAASCAIYGTRGAAGVILITTKQGEKGKIKVSLNAVYGVQSADFSKLPDLLDTEGQTYVEILEGRLDSNNDMDASYRISKNADYYLNNTDALDMIMKDGMSPEQNYNITLSGGGENITYSFLLGYYSQEGIMENASYNRYNMRSNLIYNKDRWKINFGTSYLRDDKYTASGSSITNVINYKPYTPEIDRDADSFVVPGTGYSTEVSMIEPLIRQMQTIDNDKKNSFSGNLGINYKISKSLSFDTKVGYTNQMIYGYKYVPSISIYDSVGDEVSVGSDNSYIQNDITRKESINWYGGLNYEKNFNGHKVTGMALASYELYDYKGFEAGAYGVQSGDMSEAVLDMATYKTWADSYNYYTDRLFGAVARGMYSYKDRYLLSASVRADASSKFSKDNRWGVFPSVSGGWNISEEKFWSGLRNKVNALKLRASYGMTGNQSFTSYSYLSTVAQGYDYSFGSNIEYGQTQVSYSNPDVKWETTIQTNIGIDVAFLDNSILFSADFYNTNKRDMLAKVLLPASVGAGTSTNAIIYQNVGNMNNKGIELQASYTKVFRNKFRLNVGANFSKNINEVKELASGNSIMYNSNSILTTGDSNAVTTVFAEGYEAGAFFLYKTNGIVKTEAQLTEFRKIKPDAEMGDLIFVDTNDDGSLSDADRVYCGSGVPDFEIGFNLGFNFKGFDFMTNWFASVGAEALNGVNAMSYYNQRNANLINQWSEINPTSDIPVYRGTGKEHMNYIGYSDLWVEDGSYLRLKAVTLGYTFNKKKIAKLNMTTLRVYITGQNLLTFTPYTGLDPELGGDGLTTRGLDKGQYPQSKKVMVGVKIGF